MSGLQSRLGAGWIPSCGWADRRRPIGHGSASQLQLFQPLRRIGALASSSAAGSASAGHRMTTGRPLLGMVAAAIRRQRVSSRSDRRSASA